MINRLKLRPEPDDPPPAEDYYEVDTACELFYVNADVAEWLVACMRRRWPPRWITFTDLDGSTVTIRSRLVRCLRERTGSQRAAARAFRRARRQEDKAERRPWEDDEWW